MNPILRTDRALIRAQARNTRYLHVSFTVPPAPSRDGRRPLSVAFVLDRSGSMAVGKLQLAKQAVDAAIRMLKPEDLFSVVVYDDRVDAIVPATHATADARRDAVRALAGIHARGSTDLASGWLRGCEQIAESASADTIARCLLLSDGQANRGITDQDELASRAAQLRGAHVVTSTFGVGAGFDERLMTSMADAGGGNAYFVERAEQVQDLLTSELGEALDVVARDVVLEIRTPHGADVELMNDLRMTRDPSRQSGAAAKAEGVAQYVELGDLVSEQDVSFIVKVGLPAAVLGERLSLDVRLTSKDMTMAGDSTLQWTCVDEKTNERQPRDASVDRLVAELDAMRARQESVERNRHGDYRGARDLLTLAMARIGEYAGDDGLIQRTVATLEADLSVVGEAMSSMAQKQMHYASSSPLKMRESDGRAQRRTTRERLSVTEADGHVLVHLEDGRRLLMATGSPVSLSESGSVAILGERFPAPPRWASVTLATLRSEIAAPVDGVLGMDVLGRLSWSLDVAAGALWMSKEPLANPGEALPVRMSEGVPVIDIRINGRRADAFLETGAWLSYMPAGEVSGLQPLDTRSDFVLLPEPIRFRTAIYRRTIRLGSSDVTAEFGVLPAHSGVAAAVGDRWIVGAHILAQRAFTFDARRRTVSFATTASLAASVVS